MVSIAESFYYRIFERKWRMGEALRGPSPCMPYSVSNKQKKLPLSFTGWRFYAFELRARAQARHRHWCAAVWLGVCCAGRGRSLLISSREAGAAKRVPKRNIALLFTFHKPLFLFTDLSMAGLPAELKHITQRRKRKQP